MKLNSTWQVEYNDIANKLTTKTGAAPLTLMQPYCVAKLDDDTARHPERELDISRYYATLLKHENYTFLTEEIKEREVGDSIYDALLVVSGIAKATKDTSPLLINALFDENNKIDFSKRPLITGRQWMLLDNNKVNLEGAKVEKRFTFKRKKLGEEVIEALTSIKHDASPDEKDALYGNNSKFAKELGGSTSLQYAMLQELSAATALKIALYIEQVGLKVLAVGMQDRITLAEKAPDLMIVRGFTLHPESSRTEALL